MLSLHAQKLKNFAPKILLCAQLGVLSVRNANIVFGKPSELSSTSYGMCQSPLRGACSS